MCNRFVVTRRRERGLRKGESKLAERIGRRRGEG